MKRIILIVTTFASLGFGVQAQNVNIPNANFKACLVGNTAINTNLDTEIQVTEATAFTGIIDCQNLFISSLIGIEAFINLDQLNCNNNILFGLLDLSANTSLTYLECYGNDLTGLDVTNNTALTYLECGGNALASLDVTQNTALTELGCGFNDLTSLDITQNVALTNLNCYVNLLTSLDVSNNTSLTYIDCEVNSILSLDVSNNTALTFLNCGENSIPSLDLSNSASLTDIYCYDNALTTLNVANGNNPIITTFSANGNPNLTCIQVDDAVYSTTNWTGIDVTVSFSENCSGSGVGINEIESVQVSIYPNPTSDQINISSEDQIDTIMIYDVFGSLVQQENTTIFSVENLANGIYQILVKTDKGIVRSRFIKE